MLEYQMGVKFNDHNNILLRFQKATIGELRVILSELDQDTYYYNFVSECIDKNLWCDEVLDLNF